LNTSPKKSVVIAFPSRAHGGCEEYALTIARAVHKQGYQVHTLFSELAETASLRKAFSTFETSFTPLILHYRSPGRFRRIRFGWDILRIVVVLLKKRPYVVHVSLPWPDTATELLLACALLRIRTVVTYQLVSEKFKISSKLRRRYLWAKAHHQEWVAVSENNRKILCNAFNLPESDIHLIYNGVAYPASLAQGRNVAIANGHKHLIVAVGRLSYQKGIDLLLRAYATAQVHFPEYTLALLGEGELREELEKLAKELKVSDKVLFLGRRSDVSDWLQQAELFVLASRSEGQSFALLEAMAAGVPIVASNASSIPELIGHEQEGIIFEKDDAPDLTQKLRWALSNSDQMKCMALRAKEKSRQFSREVMISDTLRLLYINNSFHTEAPQ
jgi:glycosyltransferase involved in cell wall biosynthesis